MRYKQIYLNAPKDGLDLHLKLVEYFNFYNNHRQDEGFEYQRPIDLHVSTSLEVKTLIPNIVTSKKKKPAIAL